MTASQWGNFYAKSVPSERYGLKGSTKVYQVTNNDDLLLHSYDWYSPQIYVDGFVSSVYVIQMGPWQRGHEASEDHHAIAFYKNDQLLKKYSTKEIIEMGATIQASVSHYTVFSEVVGFKRPYGNQLIFHVKTHSDDMLSFDVDSGLLTSQTEQDLNARFYDANTKIQAIKWQWYQANQDNLNNIKDVVITRTMLEEAASGKFPSLPNGYRYIPDTMWQKPTFEKIK
ncbi:MAG: hypothetical protein HKM24_03375 [Gammaproteobacteria bacterium]|nr:hypothetical protein [Gammaproteobacteria bacterium]